MARNTSIAAARSAELRVDTQDLLTTTSRCGWVAAHAADSVVQVSGDVKRTCRNVKGQNRTVLPFCRVAGLRFPVYLLLTLMTFGLTSSALGNVNVSTPFSNWASALSAFTGTFSVNRREKVP